MGLWTQLARVSRRKIVALVEKDSEWYEGLLGEIASGEALKDIGLRREIDPSAILYWINEHPERLEAYYRAMRVAAEIRAHEALAIADTPQLGIETKTRADGTTETTEGDMLGHRKLQVETRLKLISKWDRQRYGEERDSNSGKGVTIVIQKFADEKVIVDDGRVTVQ